MLAAEVAVTNVTGETMFSQMMPVLVLGVLWAIVVVPMLLSYWNQRASERSVNRWRGAMRAFASHKSLGALAKPAPLDDLTSSVTPKSRPSRPQVFVPGGATRLTPATRRPVPAAMEAVMYPDQVGRADMSEARRQMMMRRRRTLTVLSVGAVVGLLWGLTSGGSFAWFISLFSIGGLGSYVWFLRTQAIRDRERRQNRLRRTGFEFDRGYDATEQEEYYSFDTDVRIDDDDVQLLGIADTIDLTGVYSAEEFDESPMRRAV
jgi:hypothetical protein